MDPFTQNMINRTKQRREILTKSTRQVDASQSGQPTKIPDKIYVPASSFSKSSFINFEEKAEKENNLCISNGKSVLKPNVQKICLEEDVPDHLSPSSNQEMEQLPTSNVRKNRLDALAYRINDWEHEPLSSTTKQSTSVQDKGKKPSTFGKRTELTPTKYSPIKGLSTGSQPKVTTNASNITSPVKSVVLDKSVLSCLESQGFTPTASRSRLIYDFEKEHEGELEEEAADSWTYASGTPQKKNSSATGKSPMGSLGDSPAKPLRSSPAFIKTAAPKSAHFATRPLVQSKDSSPKLSTPQKIDNLKYSKRSEISDNGPALSVAKRAAQFDRPRLSAKDPAELTLSERKALFEKNKGQPPTPKVKTPVTESFPFRPRLESAARTQSSPHSPKKTPVTGSVPFRPQLESAARTPRSPHSPNVPKSHHGLAANGLKMMEQSLSAHQNASSAKAHRMKELDELRNRHGTRKDHLQASEHQSQLLDSETMVDHPVEQMPEPRSQPAVNSSPRMKGSGIGKPEDKFPRSPPKELYAGLDQVRPIRVSPPKPGNMYPCLSDIEMTTENESDESDEHDEGRQSDHSCISGDDVRDTSVAQDLDSSFTVDILGRAGLSQFINTPKRKIQEIQLNKQALLRSIVEHATSTRVPDEDSNTDGDIDDLLNEALEQPEENTPPKQLKEDGNTRRDSVEANGLYHSVSSYRKQQQDQCLTPARQLIRNPEVKPSSRTEISCVSGGYEIPIQQQIRTLQEEISAQQNVITQASQALNLCRATAEFSGSTEQVEGERLLLVASQKKQAAMNEIQRLKTEAAMKISSGKLASRGVLSLSNLSLPLKKDFIGMLAKGGDDFVHYFILLIRSRGQIIPLQMLSTVDGVQDGALRFPNLIQLQDMPPDFQIAVEVYALQTRKEKLNHETKYHIRKESSKLRLTPKKLNNKQESRLLSKLPAGSPSGSGAVRTSSFGLVGFTTITPSTLRRQDWILEKVPTTSPIDGTLQLKIQCHTDSLVEERGFLTVFEDVAGFGAWHRRWCVLSNDQLLFWKYPDDEKRKEPSSIINLRKCVTEHVDAVPHDVCARPNTFLLITVRQPHNGDKDSLVMTTYPRRTALRHLLSADLKEERTMWCMKLNQALANLRAWDTSAQEATSEGSVKSNA